MYIEKKRLAELIIRAQRGDYSDELFTVVAKIAEGVCLMRRRKTGYFRDDIDDWSQECQVWMLTNVNRINLEGYPFAFITECFKRALMWRSRKERNRLKMEDNAGQRLFAMSISGGHNNKRAGGKKRGD